MSITANSFVINREDRPERLAKFRARWGDEPELFKAMTPDKLCHTKWPVVPGWYASLASHLRVAKIAWARELPFVTVFEDDAVPILSVHSEYERFVFNLPEKWDIVNFGGIHRKMPEHVAGPVYRVCDGEHTWIECYRVARQMLPAWMAALESAMVEGRWFADTVYEFLQKVFLCYAPLNGIVFQEREWSDNHGAPCWTKDSYSPIPGWFSDNEGRAFREEVLKRGVGVKVLEMGVYLGRSSSWVVEPILSRGGEYTAVDLWEKLPIHPDASRKRSGFEWHMWKVGAWDHPKFKIVQEDSIKAAASFPDQSFDVVFIDGAHERKYVEADIRAWWPKVRCGGVMVGHDYGAKHWPDVKAVVDEVWGSPDRLVDTLWAKDKHAE